MLRIPTVNHAEALQRWLSVWPELRKSFDFADLRLSRDGIWVEYEGNLYAYRPERGGTCARLEFQMQWEPVQTAVVLGNIPPGGVFLDVGANLGIYSIKAASRIPSAQVHAFEPVPSEYEVLCRNVGKNGLQERVHCHQLALSDRDGEVSMSTNRHPLENRIVPSHSQTDDKGITQVRATTLDSFVAETGLTRIDLIKCDIEGAEYLFLKGGERSLRKHSPKILMEIERKWTQFFGIQPEQIFEFFKDLGYSYSGINHEGDQILKSTHVTADLDRCRDFFFFKS